MIVVSVVGARPQFIKLAPISEELDKSEIEHEIIHTGQHYDYNMSDIFFKEYNIKPPKDNLDVGSGSHAEQTAGIMLALEPTLQIEQPSCILVYGDTNTTLAATIVARKLGIPVAHVEAGCRSYERNLPEEINRVAVDHLSDYHFCPSIHCRNNLGREGIVGINTGDVMVDVILRMKKSKRITKPKVSGEYCIATIHRADNTDIKSNLRKIFSSLHDTDTQIIFPMHPRTKKRINLYKIAIPDNVQIIEPVSHIEMLSYISHARYVLTDSGGIQKEAFLLRTPCLTIRNATEWQETIDFGWNKLVKPDNVGDILKEKLNEPKLPVLYDYPYGMGDAAKKIVKCLKDVL